MPPVRVQLAVDAQGMFAAGKGEPDVEIVLPAETPLLALQGMDAAMRRAQVRGSVEFADTLGFVLRHLSWDFEEDLSRLVGDIAAHRIGNGIRSFTAWQRQASINAAENFSEYLRFEAGLLPTPSEVTTFSTDADTLRDDVARLEKRIQQLEKSRA